MSLYFCKYSGLGKAFVFFKKKLGLGSYFGKVKIFWNRGGAKIFYFEENLVTQKMAWSLDHKDLVGPQTHPSNNTLANKIFTTI
jgi:hypothetical protein